MNFIEATKLLKQGMAIRRKSWPDHIYIKIIDIINSEREIIQVIKGYRQEAVPFVYDTSIILSEDWIVDGMSDVIDFPNAIEMLKKRYKVHLKDWPANTYLELHPNGQDLFMRKMCEYEYIPTFECFSASDWEVVN